jgi:glucosamine-6-phosphate isomerase
MARHYVILKKKLSMRITHVSNYQALSFLAARDIIEEVTRQPDLFFCAATGGSPTGMYAEMAKEKSVFSKMRVMKMDEWGIIPSAHPDSCESYLHQHVLAPLAIPTERYFGFETNLSDTDAECARMQGVIEKEGPFDICILGLGKNGHIAFNEPAAFLNPKFHKATLAPSTIQHDPALSQGAEPAFGLCVGMEEILQSKKIIFLVTGNGKADAFRQIMTKKITTDCPASFLWLHPNVSCYTTVSEE